DSRMVLSLLQTYRQQGGASPFQQYRILGATVNGDNGTVNVEVTIKTALPGTPIPGGAVPGVTAPPPRSVYVIAFYTVRENGEWKIDPTQTLASISGMLLSTGIQQFQQNLPSLIPNSAP